jgi:PPOX class probable F420-dependent enzyme
VPRVPLVDESTEFGARAARRLREEKLGWLATVRGDGTPVPVPVWFLWDGDASFLIYSRPGTAKLRNIARNPRVSLSLDGDGQGGDIVVVLGEAHVAHGEPPADQLPQYVEKYRWGFEKNDWTAAAFAVDYSVPVRVTGLDLRGH